MELSWTTFILEIVNFLVLLWILQRFLYRPVRAAIARRQAGIEQTLAEAKAVRAEAEGMQSQYEDRLAHWEREKEGAREALNNEINAERSRLMSALQASLEDEREKAKVLEERRLTEMTHRAEEAALAIAARFAARLLSRVSGPELESRLIDAALEDLGRIPPDRRDALRSAAEGLEEPVSVTSAYPLPEDRRRAIEAGLTELVGRELPCEFREDAGVLAGLRIVVGPWVLRANLEDELDFFAGIAPDAG